MRGNGKAVQRSVRLRSAVRRSQSHGLYGKHGRNRRREHGKHKYGLAAALYGYDKEKRTLRRKVRYISSRRIFAPSQRRRRMAGKIRYEIFCRKKINAGGCFFRQTVFFRLCVAPPSFPTSHYGKAAVHGNVCPRDIFAIDQRKHRFCHVVARAEPAEGNFFL